MSALSLVNATARLGGRTVLDGVDLSVAAGELVAVVGPNGAGKSSAIRALAGLLPLSAGHALLGGDDVASLSPGERAGRAAYLAGRMPKDYRADPSSPMTGTISSARPPAS